MTQSIFIRKLFAGLLLFLFTLSNAPRQVLHDLFANHKDSCQPLTKNDSKGPQLSKSGINCQCLHLVVENPFVDNCINIDLNTKFFIEDEAFNCNDAFHSICQDLPSLRGPPSLI